MLPSNGSRWFRGRRVMALCPLVFAACGSDSDPGSSAPVVSTDSGSPSPSTAPAAPASSASGGGTATPSSAGCPISVENLATATSLRWELRDRRENHPLETNAAIKATVCVFTAGASVQFGGDPLVFRTDVVTGRDTAAIRQDFNDSCKLVSGMTRSSGGGSVCDRSGVVVEGIKGEGDRVVAAAFVNADDATARSLTPAVTKILDVLR